jgi:hypothetical protein
MTGRRRAALTSGAVLGAGCLLAAHPAVGWAAWTDSVPVGSTTLATHAVLPPASVTCTPNGLILLTPLTYSWPAKDPRYTYRVQLVGSTGAVLRTDVVPDSAQSVYSVTYAPGDLPLGDFTVRVSSYLTGSPTWTSTTYASAAGRKATVLLGLSTTCA